jgi:hypothetical protein
MSRTKLVIALMSTALILGPGASTALAAHEFLVNGKGVAKEEKVEVDGTGAIFLEATVAKTATHLACGEGVIPTGASNVLEELGKFKTKLELKACTSTSVAAGVEEDAPKCKVPNFNLEATGELTEAGIATVSGTGAEKILATVKIEEVAGAGACALAGTFKLKGSTGCDIPDYLVTHPGFGVGCTPPGGKEVKFGEEPAKLDLALGVVGTKGQSFSSN